MLKMAEYGHSLYFKAWNVTHREVEMVRTHFETKIMSGGGECGPLEKVEGNTYKISFKSQEDQEQVLQRKFHTVPLPDRELRLMVSRSLPGQTLYQEVGAAAAPPSPAFGKTNTKCLEKTFPLDGFLLLYLRDTPEASRLLEKQLSFVGCTVDVNLDEETAVVSGDVTKGPGGASSGAAERWEEQVDRVLISFTENYDTYHCVEAEERKVLLLGPSMEGDEVKVYTEAGYPVIVGEVEAVRERVASLKKSLPVRREASAAEQKFKLVAEELSREMATRHPDAKFSRRPNLVVLEGSEQGVKSGEAKLDELTKKVQQERVQLQPALISFVASTGAAAKYQTKMDLLTTQEHLALTPPKLVDCFDELLNLAGLKPTDVTMKASHSPSPRVVLTGPQCKVQEAKQALISSLSGLTMDLVVLEGTGAQRYFQGEGRVSKELVESSCKVIIREGPSVQAPIGPPAGPQGVRGHSSSVGGSASYAASYAASYHIGKVDVGVKLCSMEEEQVHVLVVPMINKQLTSTMIGIGLSKKAGNALKLKFDSAASRCAVAPGDVLQVDGPPTLGCSKIFFIECLPWDGVQGRSVQALRKGLKTCLDLCGQQNFGSIAFTVIGPGKILQYPLNEAIEVLSDTLCWFGSSVSSGSLSTIHVVVKPGYPDSQECCCNVLRRLSANMNQGGQAIFRSLTSDLDDITIRLVGGVKLRLVFGDITDETTDVVVNSTDFKNFNITGVCKDILRLAGPAVEAQLKAVKTVTRGSVIQTPPGLFPCKAILHVSGEKSADVTEGLMWSIIDYCESNGFKSVAIPAICAGVGGLQPDVVAGAILRGVKTSTNAPLHVVSDIHVILDKIEVFLAFQEEAMQMFSTAVVSRGDTLAAPASPQVYQPDPLTSAPAPADLSVLDHSAPGHKSTFMVVGLSRKSVDDGAAKFRDQYETQCSTQCFKKEELEGLRTEDVDQLQQLLDSEGLYARRDPAGGLTVRGLKDGVSKTAGFIGECVRGRLKKDLRLREEKDLSTRVVWCIMGQNQNWEQLPPAANYSLENRDLARGIVDAWRTTWTADLWNMDAKSLVSAQSRKLKRLENLPDFPLPLYWDNMAAGETMKAVTLQPFSSEFKTLRKGFMSTAADKTVVKIERLQNTHLRRGYEGRKKQISDKNPLNPGGANEKLLYHGTTQDNSKSIMKTGFDRRFCGQNGTTFGDGVYFAVNAKYSAHPNYSKPAADGSQLMFVARVLTGTFTQGQSGMKVPPLRDGQRPDDRFDSVVDQPDNPSMYVVFHDNQSYPDYLITFM